MAEELKRFPDPKQLSPLALAFIGDGVYSLLVRERLLQISGKPIGELHKESVKLVNAKAQSNAIELISEKLTEEEMGIYKRGRNANSAHHPKNTDVIDYRRATGVEALFGYLYLSNRLDRMYELFDIIFSK